ncbi:MAG: von Willebrand factor type A domain-containing protein [Spirulinaceae cyanobacterium]
MNKFVSRIAAILSSFCLGLSLAIATEISINPAVAQEAELTAEDEQFQSLEAISKEYECSEAIIKQETINREDFALAVENCLNKLEEIKNQGDASIISPEDVAVLQQLQQEFKPILGVVEAEVVGRRDLPSPVIQLRTLRRVSRNSGGITALPPSPNNNLPEDFNREEYNPIDENPFFRATDKPLSTFSIDVDTASYSNLRRFIKEGSLPPKDAVRIEELINYFTYNYPQPEGEQPFSLTTEIAQAPWNKEHKLVHIGLQGKRIAQQNLPPSNLVFLLDVSGSMNSPDKLPLLKSAFQLLVNELDESDRVTIVVYAGAAGVVLPPTPGNQKDTIIAAINSLEAGGSTAGGEGINLAYKLAQDNFIKSGNNRVILATDGDFNIGVSSEAGLVRLIEEKRRDGIFLTTLGFGTGNLQDAKMEQLANKGNGNYAYIDSLLEARKVLVSEMGATLLTIAKDVKLQVEFNPEKVQAYRLIGYENRLLQDQDFNDDTKDAGELGAGHSVTALYEIIPVGVETDLELPEIDPLRYQTPPGNAENSMGNELLNVKLRYKEPQGETSQLITNPLTDADVILEQASNDFKFSAAVAAYGMMLRESQYKGATSFNQILELARAGKGEDQEGYRQKFILMVEDTRKLALE